jgi:hypothetical protein
MPLNARRCRLLARFSAGVAIAGVSMPSRAQVPAGVFDVPAACGSEADFRSELARLGGTAAKRAWPTLVRIARDDASDDYHLTLEVAGRRRELHHADCNVLFRSAIVIAVASVRAEPPSATSPLSPPPSPPAAPSAQAPARSEPSPRDEGPSELRGSAAVGAGIALGVVPGTDLAVELRGELWKGMWGLGLAARYFPPRFVSTEGRGADIQAFGLRGAAAASPTPWLALSAGVDVDRLSGSGASDLDPPATGSAWSVAPSLELSLIPFRTKHLALELSAEGRVALMRATFEVRGFGTIYRVPPFGFVSLGRGVWRFP